MPRYETREKSPWIDKEIHRRNRSVRHENIGRHLISVQWDGGVTDCVFPSEIEIIADSTRFCLA
jgi:hypothetical protein